ncbi:MAG: response regulator transcription factor [Cytophagaceae bacterium]
MNELRETEQSQALNLAERIKNKINHIALISNDLPGVIIIHDLRTGCVEYMSERGLKLLKTSMKELKELGTEYFEKFFNPEDARNYTPKFLAMLERNDMDETFSYFQQVSAGNEQNWKWYITASKVLMCDDQGKPCLAISAAHPIDEMKSTTYKLERLLEQKEMMQKNLSKFARLTKREKEIIILMVSGDSSVSIAEKLFISASTVDQHRKNIKNKLNIKNLPEMVRFAQAFDMI